MRASPLVSLWHTDRRLGAGRGRLSPPGRLGSQGWCPNLCPKHTSRVPQQYPWLNCCKPWLNCSRTPNGIVEHEPHSEEGTGNEPQEEPVDQPTSGPVNAFLCGMGTDADASSDEEDPAIPSRQSEVPHGVSQGYLFDGRHLARLLEGVLVVRLRLRLGLGLRLRPRLRLRLRVSAQARPTGSAHRQGGRTVFAGWVPCVVPINR